MTKSDLLPVTIDEAVDGHVSADLPTITVRIPAWESMADYNYVNLQWFFFDSPDHQIGWESFYKKMTSDMIGKEIVFSFEGSQILKPYNGGYADLYYNFPDNITDGEGSPFAPPVKLTIGELVHPATYIFGLDANNTVHLNDIQPYFTITFPSLLKHAGDIIVPYIQFKNTETGAVGPVTSLEPHIEADNVPCFANIYRADTLGYNYFTVYYTVKRYDRPFIEQSQATSCYIALDAL